MGNKALTLAVQNNNNNTEITNEGESQIVDHDDLNEDQEYYQEEDEEDVENHNMESGMLPVDKSVGGGMGPADPRSPAKRRTPLREVAVNKSNSRRQSNLTPIKGYGA